MGAFRVKTFLLILGRVMGVLKIARKTHEDRLFVEPAGWAPLYGAWQERAKSTRELAERATNDHAKKLLLMIADVYDRLSK
jgi:hypothetical protein